MKSLLALGALLLSGLPAVADDFLYVSCEMNGTNKKTALPSGKLIDEGPLTVDTLLFKVDLTNKKLRSNINAEWSDIRIEGNQIIQDNKFNEKDFSAQVRGVMPLNPPGPASVHNWYKTKTEYQVIKAEGVCTEIDSSAFDAASK